MTSAQPDNTIRIFCRTRQTLREFGQSKAAGSNASGRFLCVFFRSRQRQNARAGRYTRERESGELSPQLGGHEIDFILVPIRACRFPAGFQLRARFKRHIADQNFPALVQLFSEAAEERRLRVVRQMVQGVCSDNKIIALLLQRLREPKREIARIQLRIRHFLLCRLDHFRRKILPENFTALRIQSRGQRSGSEADVQHLSARSCQNGLIDAFQHIPVSGERIGIRFVRRPDGRIVAVRPEVEALFLQHGCTLS